MKIGQFKETIKCCEQGKGSKRTVPKVATQSPQNIDDWIKLFAKKTGRSQLVAPGAATVAGITIERQKN